MHDSVISGHLGYKKTTAKVRRKFYWFEMRQETKLFKELNSIYKSVSFAFNPNDQCIVTYFNDSVVNIRCNGNDFYSLYQLTLLLRSYVLRKNVVLSYYPFKKGHSMLQSKNHN